MTATPAESRTSYGSHGSHESHESHESSESVKSLESYNPWTVVNLVFHHLVDKGLHPVFGESGDPGPPATALLLALGIEPSPEGNREVMRDVRAHLEQLRNAVLGEPPST